jgi:hypothetical protein
MIGYSGGTIMAVKLAPAFYNRKSTGVWLKVMKHTEQALKEARLDDFEVLVSCLPDGKEDLSNSRIEPIDCESEEEIDFEDDIDIQASVNGRQFEVRFHPDLAIKDPKEFAELYIVGTLDQFVYSADSGKLPDWSLQDE